MTSVPGRSGKNRSAISAVCVRRGSIEHDAQLRVRGLRRGHALEQHRMAPREIRADEHDELGLLEIRVVVRHRVGAERALVARDRRRHAEPRVGVDVRAADEALHQLVGDVVVLGQELARDVERDGVRTVLGDRARETRCATASSASSQLARAPRISGCSSRPSRPSVSPSAAPFEHMRPEVRRMLGIAADLVAAVTRARRDADRSRRRSTGTSCVRRS